MNTKKTIESAAAANRTEYVPARGNGQMFAGAERSIEQTIAYMLLVASVAVFIIHFLFFRHSFPPVNVDEASFFSPAQSFATKGNLASDIHKSFLPGASQYTYWMPPFQLVLLGGFFKIFGTTVMAAKIFSLLFSCASALLVASLARTTYGKVSAAALFLICPFIIITSAFIRVEAVSIFLTLLAIIAVKREWSDFILGVIAAVGISTHPLLVACAAGLGLTSLREGIKPLLLFSLGFAVAISPYVWYILQDVELFKQQMTLQFLRKANAKLLNLSPMYLLQSVPSVLLALFCLYKTKAANELRLFLTVSMFLALVIVLRSNEFNYYVYLVPYTIAALVLAIDRKRESALFRWMAPLALYGFFALLLAFKLVKYKFRTDTDFNQLVSHLNTNTSWKGKQIFAAGGPDVSTYLMMYGADVEREVPVPQTLPATWFDKYNHVIEIKDNGFSGEGVFEEPDKPKPWRVWKASAFTTSDSAYTLTQYTRQ